MKAIFFVAFALWFAPVGSAETRVPYTSADWVFTPPPLEPVTRCILEFKSDRPEKLLDKITAKLAKVGGRASPRSSWTKDDALIGHVRTVGQVFDLPPTGASAIAKSLTNLATLDKFSCSPRRGSAPAMPPGLEDKIALLEREMGQNARALKDMPVTRSLLSLRLGYLRGIRDQVRTAAVRASVEVTVLDVR